MNITKNDIGQYTITGEFDIASDVEGLQTILRFVLDNTPLKDVIQSMLKDKRINKQVHIRAHPSEYVHGSIVRVPFTGGRAPADPITEIQNRAAAAGMTVQDYILAEVAKRTAPKLEPLK